MKVAVGALLVLILAGVLWGAGELHYKSCVEAAEARTPITESTDPVEGELYDRFGIGTDDEARRRRAVDGCSRLPF